MAENGHLELPALEDKIVQGAVAEVLSAVYEADFCGFSYGFRPGRNPHMALDALHTAIMSQRVNWVLDADIRSFSEVNRVWTACLAAAFTRSRLGIRITRLCVRILASPCGILSGRSLPSARLVFFDGFMGTMNQSDSRPQLGRQLWQCLVADPRQRPVWRTRSGLSCSDNYLPCVIRPSTPTERHHLA